MVSILVTAQSGLETKITLGEVQILKNGDLESTVLGEPEGSIVHLRMAIRCHDVLVWS